MLSLTKGWICIWMIYKGAMTHKLRRFTCITKALRKHGMFNLQPVIVINSARWIGLHCPSWGRQRCIVAGMLPESLVKMLIFSILFYIHHTWQFKLANMQFTSFSCNFLSPSCTVLLDWSYGCSTVPYSEVHCLRVKRVKGSSMLYLEAILPCNTTRNCLLLFFFPSPSFLLLLFLFLSVPPSTSLSRCPAWVLQLFSCQNRLNDQQNCYGKLLCSCMLL